MKMFIEKNKKTADRKAFEIVKKQVLSNPDMLLGLAVGKTTDNLYKLISQHAKNNPEFWKRIKIFQIDEKLGISPKSKASFNNELKSELRLLFKLLKKENIFLIDGTKKPKNIIKEGYKFIKKNKEIDLIILGLGPEYDPHIAYNTTGKSSINSRMRVVNLHPKIAREIKTRKGITLGIKDILKTKKVILLAYGKNKAKSLKLAFLPTSKVDMKKASASALSLHKNLHVVVDKHAAKYIRP